MTKTAPATGVCGLSTGALEQKLHALAGDERHALADFLVCLAEFDARRAYLDRACSSCFTYLTGRLGFSTSSAFRRIVAARLSAKFPAILERIRGGRLNLISLCMVRNLLCTGNELDLLNNAGTLLQRELEKFVAARSVIAGSVAARSVAMAPTGIPAQAPAPLLPAPKHDQIRFLPVSPALPTSDQAAARNASPTSGVGFSAESKSEGFVKCADEAVSSNDESCPPNQLSMKVRIHFTADAHLVERIEEAKALLSNTYGAASLEQVFSHVLEDFLKRHSARRRELRRFERQKKRAKQPSPESRHIPQAVKDAVWLRDGGRCAFMSEDGRRCGEKNFLHYDHITPWATGGSSTDPSNIRLLCAAHNQHAAVAAFCADFRKKRNGGGSCGDNGNGNGNGNGSAAPRR